LYLKDFNPGTQEADRYLTGQGFRATPQMDFLRDHQILVRKENRTADTFKKVRDPLPNLSWII
jgi:hypothetical protein